MIQALCTNAVRLVAEGRLPAKVGQIAQVVAKDPHAGLLSILQRATIDPDSFTANTLDKLLAQPAVAHSRGVSRFSDHGVRRLSAGLHDLAWRYDLRELPSLDGIERMISDEIARATEDPVLSIPSNAREQILDILGTRLGVHLFDRSRIDRSHAPLSLLPSSPDFTEYVRRHFLRSEEVVDSWRGSILWLRMATVLFAGMLPYSNGTSAETNWDTVERIEESVEYKRRWFDELMALGVRMEDIERGLHSQVHYDMSIDIWITAVAELKRFAPSKLPDRLHDRWFSLNNKRIDLLKRRIRELHRIDPWLEEDRFIPLLPPLAGESARHIINSIWGDLADSLGSTSLQLYPKTISLVYWHMKPSEQFARYLSRLFNAEAKSSHTFYAFCDEHFGIKAERFWDKLEQLDEAGVDISGVISEFEKNFPAAVNAFRDSYPGKKGGGGSSSSGTSGATSGGSNSPATSGGGMNRASAINNALLGQRHILPVGPNINLQMFSAQVALGPTHAFRLALPISPLPL